MTQLEAERNVVNGPDKWGIQPRVSESWLLNHRQDLEQKGINTDQYRRGMVVAYVSDSSNSLINARNLLNPDQNLPPSFKAKVPGQRENLIERVDWLIGTDVLPQVVTDPLNETLETVKIDEWKDLATIQTVQEKWDIVIEKLNKEMGKEGSILKKDQDYYLTNHDTVGKMMLEE